MQNSSTSSSKLFLLRFLLPAVLIVGLFGVLSDAVFDRKIILHTQSSGAYKIYRNIHISRPQEIPIFGSSRASGSYIPDLIDTSCFNYGIEKTQFNLLELFLKNELAKNKTTPIIINFDYELWADWIGDYANYIPNLGDPEIAAYFSSYDKWYYHVKGLRYYGLYQHYFKNYTGNNSNKNYLDKGGFFLLEKTSPKDLQDEIELRKNTPFAYTANPVKENRFIRLLSAAKGRSIFIVVAPYHHSYLETLKGQEEVRRFFERIKTIPGVYVIDHSSVPYPDELFKNTTHLNYLGAQRFSKELKAELHAAAPAYFK